MDYIPINDRINNVDDASAEDFNRLKDNVQFLKEIKTPLTLNVGGVLATHSSIFQNINGFIYRWYGSELLIKKIMMTVGKPDSGASQPIVDILFSGKHTMDAPLQLYGYGSAYKEAVLSSTSSNLIIEYSNSLQISFTQGSNGDAENLAIQIYCEVN